MNKKYIFVTGGVVSGLGKGICAASLGRLLKNRGYKVTMQKFDPYLNVDPGTMSPHEHGEVFVTEDGGETDLDLGHYERFIDENLTKNSSISMGKIYQNVIEKERSGEYLGKTVQVIPHVTNEIKNRIYSFEDSDADIIITEIGGTIGDIEGLSMIEAIRQVGLEKNKDDVIYVHVTLLPYISGSNEIKTKPTQHSVKELQSLGIQPNIVVCRTDSPMSDDIKEKIALFCNIRKASVIENMTADNLYQVPLLLEEAGLGREVCNHLRLESFVPNNSEWEKMVKNIMKIKKEINVCLVGKYVKLEDSYISVIESLHHAGFNNNVKVNVEIVDSSKLTAENVSKELKKYQAIVVPGGFGNRGIEGMIEAIKYAREENIPFLGICLGMQLTVIEYARNVLGLSDANSEEFDKKTKNMVITLMEEQKKIKNMGGTMRLGKYACSLLKNSKAYSLYNADIIYERHRHRFEYNNAYRKQLEENGLISCGINKDLDLVEIVEIPKNHFFVACQFHPEFKSRPNNPGVLFNGLIKSVVNKK